MKKLIHFAQKYEQSKTSMKFCEWNAEFVGKENIESQNLLFNFQQNGIIFFVL